MKPILIAAAALLAAAFLFIFLLLPPRRLALPPASWQSSSSVAVGAVHVHTRRSDGSGTPELVAEAAARAGLNFVIFTDHGDGTRTPDPPAYRFGVLCIDAVEISTSEGHYVALGIPRAPYPLGGEPRDVIEDVSRLGGFGFAAHPDSRKPDLQWHEWTAPFDGVEWLNADSEWRDETRERRLRALLTYPFRPVETIGSLLDRPDETLLRWDALSRRRRVIGIAGADAHARLGWRDSDVQGYRKRWFIEAPSYEASFRTFAVRVHLQHTFSGDPAADAAALLSSIRAGHVYTGIDAVASPAALEFTAASGEARAEQGDRIDSGKPVTFYARVNAATGGVIALRKDGDIIAQHPVPELTFEAPATRGVYRIEVVLAHSPGLPPIPWIVSNPIYVEPAEWDVSRRTPELPPAHDSWNVQGGPWHAEHDQRSQGTVEQLDPPKSRVRFSYRLADGPRDGLYAALVLSAGNALAGHDRFSFVGWASGPMRISVQARQPSGARWKRSIYLDRQPQQVTIPFRQMNPVTAAWKPHFVPTDIDTVLFVVDTTNTAPGTQGQFEVSDLRVEH
jgi:hypothetical protein